MANRKNLGIIGFIMGGITAGITMGGITAGIMTIGLAVVQSHLDSRFNLDDANRRVLSASLPTVVR